MEDSIRSVRLRLQVFDWLEARVGDGMSVVAAIHESRAEGQKLLSPVKILTIIKLPKIGVEP